jgi:hypothetical protein
MIRTILLSFFAAILTTCATTSETNLRSSKQQPPHISKDMALETALKAGIDFGGDTARDVRKLISKRKQWPLAEKMLYQAVQDGIINYDNTQLVNAVMLYISGPVPPQEALFNQLVSSGRPLARQLAWQMASALPGKVMRAAMEREMNRAVLDGDEEDILIPAMAAAAQANRMTSAYSLVRRGLMTKNLEDFAQAMAALNPEQATLDFLDYLALCPPEELRQMTVSSINIFAATVALNHMVKFPPSTTISSIDVLFNYAISRNPGLSDLSMTIVENIADKNPVAIALALSRMPVWTQIAFIEGSRRNMTSTKRVFLGELKRVSAQADVVDELGDIKL